MDFEKFLTKMAKEDGIEKLVVGGIIRNDQNEYLIISRKKDDFMGGIDEIPSGKLDFGETLFEALTREVKEETNLDVTNIKNYVNYFDYLSSSGKKSRQYNFVVSVKSFNDIKLTEHDKYSWLDINDCITNEKITSKTKNSIIIADFNIRQINK